MATRRIFIRRLIGAMTFGLVPGAAIANSSHKLLTYNVVHDPDHYVAMQWDLPPETKHLYFNGEDWTTRAMECHVREGWVIAFDVEPNDNAQSPWQSEWRLVQPTVRRKHFGKVELRAA